MKDFIEDEKSVTHHCCECFRLQTELDKAKEKAKSDYGFIYDKLVKLQKGYKKSKSKTKQLQAELEETEAALVDAVALYAKAVDKHRWIPVSEGLPAKSEKGNPLQSDIVQGTGGLHRSIEVYYDHRWKNWYTTDGFVVFITHWKLITLPEKDGEK